MTGQHKAWCPGSAVTPSRAGDERGDGQYENQILPSGSPDILVKQYQRQERFMSEVRALRLLGAHGLSPLARESCAEHLAVRIERVAGKPLAGPLVLGSPSEERFAGRLGGTRATASCGAVSWRRRTVEQAGRRLLAGLPPATSRPSDRGTTSADALLRRAADMDR
ncbi:hypothetical protein GCM10018987_58560 [Streptomyces cremeus]